jgi:hypothetical protein
LARKVKIFRKDNVIGHKRLIYAINPDDNSKKVIRKLTVEFFKEVLGFKDNEIVFISRKEFKGRYSHETTEFSTETQKMLNNSIIPIFEDKNLGFAKQILHIALCESYVQVFDERPTTNDDKKGIYSASNYFKS